MALQQDASSRSENLYVVLEKEGSTPNTLHGIGNCTENGTTRKLYPPTDVSVPLRCTHNYFRSSLKIVFTAFLELNYEN